MTVKYFCIHEKFWLRSEL